MSRDTSLSYVPALRSKAGEHKALSRIAPDVAERVAPRWILPPPSERDTELKRVLTLDEIVVLTARRIGQHWPMRPAFLDPQFLFDAFGDGECTTWLPRLFATARHHNVVPIPVATLDDRVGVRGEAYRKTIDEGIRTRIGLKIAYSEIDSDLTKRVDQSMSVFGVRPEECALFIDFAHADFSDPTAIVDVACGAMEIVQALGLWQHVIFQGTSFPERNPAVPGSFALVHRSEWLAWKSVIESDEYASKHLIFGDYCADSAKFVFGSGKAIAPIRHFRYCSNEHWFVARGPAEVSQREAMRSVSEEILRNGEFAGRDFSYADDYIFRTAKGLSNGGNAITWREINTAHHVTKVVSDLGKMRGYDVRRHAVEEISAEPELF